MRVSDTAKLAVLGGLITVGFVLQSDAQGRRPMRQHTTTEAQNLDLVAATVQLRGSKVKLRASGDTVKIRANGIPDHAVGQFPNRGNPHEIKSQNYRFSTDTDQLPSVAKAFGMAGLFGVAVNGVPFDPAAAEFWKGNQQSGWQYEALGGAVTLGLDQNFAHVQPSGAYHYHGLPWGLMQQLGWSSNKASPLIGYAADGFPIYAITAEVNGKVREMTSSYRLKSGSRPGGSGPSGRHDGAFVQDYQYQAGLGALDECNGAQVVTDDFPGGTYAYFLSQDFPVIPRCLKGDADRSFSKRRG
ncbi:YHYH protein [Parasedimentitalea huanghaiensis]|uniref:YHYH protein n=1 Tax=Parasedimentitalea huanghaiensis TaxID=2682100 RepID=A0A6L6WD56_9RHOB|nr:YHYH protein [Zongyanglinia huanghaiensis]MVO15736.1 YHYH protein [Zongyanglinia huanghaiensis]